MAIPPPAGAFNLSYTEQERRDHWDAMLAVLLQQAGTQAPEPVDVAGGSLSGFDQHRLVVDTESDAAQDDLSSIDDSDRPEGSLLLISPETSVRDVTLKHGTGNIEMLDGLDLSLRRTWQMVMLELIGGTWFERARWPEWEPYWDVTWLNGFGPHSGAGLRYARSAEGKVHLVGRFTNTSGVSGGTDICVVPSGYTPVVSQLVLTTIRKDAGYDSVGMVAIRPNNLVRWQEISLDGGSTSVAFEADDFGDLNVIYLNK